MRFAEWLKGQRIPAVAKALGVSLSTVYAWARGEVGTRPRKRPWRPRYERMVAIEKLSRGAVTLADWR